jgi:hypothetical protein
MGLQALGVLADRGYFDGEEVLVCEGIGVTPYVPKPLTSGSKAKGRFGKQDFVYLADDDVYRCPAGETLTRRFTSVEDGMNLYVYWTAKCAGCPLKSQCTSGKERRIKRWEHEAVIDAMQERAGPEARRHAHSPSHRRARLRHAQGLDGSDPLQDPDPRQGPNGDEPPRSGLQSETGGRLALPAVADRGDPGLTGPAIPDAETETSPCANLPLRRHSRVLTQPRPKADILGVLCRLWTIQPGSLPFPWRLSMR